MEKALNYIPVWVKAVTPPYSLYQPLPNCHSLIKHRHHINAYTESVAEREKQCTSAQ